MQVDWHLLKRFALYILIIRSGQLQYVLHNLIHCIHNIARIFVNISSVNSIQEYCL